MRSWAEIRDGVVNGVHKMPDDLVPEFNPNSYLYAIEVTNISPMPASRWKYDIDTGTFSEPDTVYLNPITSKEFFLRLTGPERVALISSVDNQIKQFAFWIGLSGDINLNDPIMATACGMLESEGIIAAGRAAEILIIEET